MDQKNIKRGRGYDSFKLAHHEGFLGYADVLSIGSEHYILMDPKLDRIDLSTGEILEKDLEISSTVKDKHWRVIE